MKLLCKLSLSRWSALTAVFALPLLLVACGASATPAPFVSGQDAAVVKEVPVVKEAPAVKGVIAVASPTPVAPAPVQAAPTGTVRIMVAGWGSERFDRAYGTGSGNNYSRILHGYLISTNEHLALVPGIATRWDLSDEGRTWTFTIRKGVKFHDGSEVSLEDVLWAFRHYFDPEAVKHVTAPGVIEHASDTATIKEVSPDRVSLTSKKFSPGFAFDIAEAGTSWYAVMPRRGALWDREQEAAYDRNPIGAGPMKLVRHIPAYVMRFERFDDHYYQPKNGFPEDKRVNFKQLELFLTPEEATRTAALRAGEIDIALLSLVSRKQVEAGGGRMLFGREAAYFRLELMGCYRAEFPCQDKRVRQALDYAIDKQLMRDRLYGADLMEARGWYVVTPSTIGYSPELDPWPFDPNKARQLLAEAGYKTPTNPTGKDFGKLIVNTWQGTGIPFLPETAQLIADSWKNELGIDVRVNVGEEVSLKKAKQQQKLFGQVALEDDETRGIDLLRFRRYFGDRTYDRRLSEDPELIQLTEQALRVVDPKEQANALNALYRRLRDESYALGIGYVNVPWGVSPRIAVWRPYPMAFYPTAFHTITLK